MAAARWESISWQRFLAFAAASGAFLLLVFRSEPGFIPVLDHANLLFHEAGHPIVGIFSRRLEPYGGTIGQLVFPVVLMVACWRKGQPMGVAAMAIWLFENLLNIARYVADARTMELPLVGGGDHDWNTILFRWNALDFDTTVARGFRMVAWAGMGVSFLWVAWRVACDFGRKKPVQATTDGWELGR